MTRDGAPRSMVRTLQWRLMTIVALVVVLVGTASIIGLRIVVDTNADRAATLAGEAVSTWGTVDSGQRVVDARQLTKLAPIAAVVVLLGSDGEIVAASSDATLPLSQLEPLVSGAVADSTVTVDLAGRSTTFTRIEFEAGTVFRDGTDVPLESALVGVGSEGADRLIRALFLAELILLGLVIVAVAVTSRLVITRTTGSLTALADHVENDDVVGIAHVARDYSETAELADALQRLDVRRQRSERELRDFVADTSHELKTPLTKIQGWSELHFQNPDDGDRTERALESIVEESHRMRRLVDQLSALASADSLTTPRLAPLDLSALVNRLITKGDVDGLSARVEPGIVVRGDEHSLVQVVRNLVSNAFTHGGDGVTVAVALEAVGTHAVLSVEDDGVGIPPELSDSVFERFVTGDRTQGSGLGLAIVRSIVEGHGGSVGIDTTAGRGATVRVVLPLAA
ncbi:two-component system OmpR family sensor kinase [Microbacteriaceae bacterium SG_E_30_P1]|uniref:histidine kinase n=1 Tax=Antiquaquibacter oligotrophicus TaxID=2880260 RepID=A0ABT6KN97_9MICO|nr:HAMP domain-containing sensor histidine kinase [Antiquaquibacter oligotrophicus]MDH6181339.1 two-component system OmpR family sensor kinase [Antiquaquibacter oligotrophicus]UDF12968.1 HAMP domain-containing histidine kinase [Antiquaquibacter oligotrophicus]